MAERLNDTLSELLVCPMCKGELRFSPGLIECGACNLQFPQAADDWYDLLPPPFLEKEDSDWEERQVEMEDWYKQLMTDPKEVNYCFNHDYTPYTSLLATLSGLVLDIGGGNGIVRQFLPKNVQYITIEPSLDWLESDWEAFAPYFSCLETKPSFVRGIGEYLPFPVQSFDAVLSFWSLNHASQPERIFQEVYNILKPNGEFLLVLEDMEPGLFDTDYRTSDSEDSFPVWEVVTMKIQHLLTGQKWPLQSDHIRIEEADIQKWISQRFKIRQRKWVGQYLTFKFQKI